MNRSLIDNYEQGAAKVKTAIAGLSREQLLKRPADGSWSIQQIVIHIQDAELVLADRMKRIIAEDNATLLGFDESAFMQTLHPEAQSASDAATIIELNRRNLTRIFRDLPDEAFARAGTHNQRGRQTLEFVLLFTTEHLDHHLKFIEKKKTL